MRTSDRSASNSHTRWLGGVGAAIVAVILLAPGSAFADGDPYCESGELGWPPRPPAVTFLISHSVAVGGTAWVKNTIKQTLHEWIESGMCPEENDDHGPVCSPGNSRCDSGDQICAAGYNKKMTCPADAGPYEQDDGGSQDPEEGPILTGGVQEPEDTGEQGPCYCWPDEGGETCEEARAAADDGDDVDLDDCVRECSSDTDCFYGSFCIDGKCRCREHDWSECDPIWPGLTVFDEEGCQGDSEMTNHFVAESEEEETYDDVQQEVDLLPGLAGTAFCSDTTWRPHGEPLLEHQRQEKFPSNPRVTKTMWDRKHANIMMIDAVPQTSNSDDGNQVSKALDAACKLVEGDDGGGAGSVPAILTFVMNNSGKGANNEDGGNDCTPDDDPVDVYAGMLAAAGDTGSCCYDANGDGDCDDGSDQSFSDHGDWCSHVRGLSEATLRSRLGTLDATDGNYICDHASSPGQSGNVPFCKLPGARCQLAGDAIGSCSNPTIAGDTTLLDTIAGLGSPDPDPCADEGDPCSLSGCTGIEKCVRKDSYDPSAGESRYETVCAPKWGFSCSEDVNSGLGRCKTGGDRVCNAGNWECEADRRPMPEICNGLDDDCNGEVDDIAASWDPSRGVWKSNWSSITLDSAAEARTCGKATACVCSSGSDVDSAHRGSSAGNNWDEEFDEMVSNTDTGCTCSE